MDVQAREKMERINKLNMAYFGWYAHAVPAAQYDGVHANVHTHGLMESYGHLDLQCTLNVDPRQSHLVFSTMIEQIKNGRVYEEGVVYTDILTNGLPVKFKKFPEGTRDVLRILVPDKHGRLPDDPECEDFFKTQLDDYPFGSEGYDGP